MTPASCTHEGDHLPFAEMLSADDLLADDSCLAQPGDRTRIRLPQAEFRVRWFNPHTGGELREGSVDEIEGGDAVSPGEPPGDPDQDWVVLITRN